ncbi:mechanosensitive ion channel [Roseiconus nitratireducens]|uniref:Mechanosensitive ion channel n=1 Tax=Roseiconus nitratireducens TaxID=2605748 RepID=A0A5M6CV35_9BACT|nr:mechanosensitive ion channel family protein [Roseiconus nitratireducens]KAA5539084.1 mechanosensitive ion channel [Roseiconus nitratireducens]
MIAPPVEPSARFVTFFPLRFGGVLTFLLTLVIADVGSVRAQPPVEQAAESAQAAAEEAEQANSPSNPVAVDNVADDQKISRRLSDIFASANWFKQLEVKSDSGIVTLSGLADTEEHREWAGNVARKTQDVVAVVNRLQVDTTVDFSSSADVVRTSLDRLWRDFLVRLPLLVAGLVVIVATALFSKAVGWMVVRLLDRRKIRVGLKDLCHQLLSIAIWVAGLLIATVVIFPGMTPSKALTVLGLGSVAIGFAFKDIFENFFAGILILWRYPFDRGDFITAGEITGRVEEITVRNTMIRRLDGELTVVPNANLFKNDVDVLTNQPQRRVRIICGVAYGEDVDQSRAVILEAVQSCDHVVGKRTVEVFAQEFASSSINFEVAWWTGAKPVDIRRSRDEVVAAIKRALDQAGIEIPFPYRTLTFKDPRIADALAAEPASREADPETA